MMRACYVLLEYPVLSQTFVVDEIAALREAGSTVLTVSLEGGPGADVALGTWRASSRRALPEAAKLLVRRPKAVAVLLRGPLTMGYRLKLLAAAYRAARERCDVVHAHFGYRSADGAEVIGRALGLGHSVTVHAHDIFVERTHLRRRLRAAKTVITVCEYNRRHLELEYESEVRSKLHVIPCSTRVGLPPARQESSPRIVLAVGRLVPKKGFDLLVQAAAGLDADVVVIGEGPERDRLEALAAGTNVRLLGAQSRDEIQTWLSRASLFCLPCRVAPDGDRDSMPVVIKEAMAAGLPVVSTREVGVPEMVEDGVTGVLVPPDDPVALARALADLLRDPERRASMGAAGQRLVADRFDLRDQAVRLIEVLGP